MLRLRCLVLLFFFAWAIPLRLIAQKRIAEPFYRLALPNDFPNTFINAIVRDQKGLLWMGTNNGLCRYISAKEIKVYNSAEIPELKSDLIEELLCDSKGNLWIGTRHGGLTKYDPKRDRWTNYVHLPGDSTSLQNNDVLCLEEDRKGRVWVGTEEGVSIYQEERDNFVGFSHKAEDSTSLSANSILSIMEDHKGRIWLGTWGGGLNVCVPDIKDIHKSTFRRIPLMRADGNPESIWSMFQDSENRYWIGTHFSGLNLMQVPSAWPVNPERWTIFPQFHSYLRDPDDIHSLSNDIILADIQQDSRGNIWVGTPYGLSEIAVAQLPDPTRYNHLTEEKPEIKFRRHHTDPFNMRTIDSDNLTCLYIDEQDLLWVGTDRGITQYNWYAKQIKSHKVHSELYSGGSVEGIFIPKGDSESLILGLVSGEVIHYNLKTGESQPIHEVYDFIEPIRDAIQFSKFEEGILYIARPEKITRIDFNHRTFSSIPLSSNIKFHAFKSGCRSLSENGKERFWIGSEEGVYLIEDGGKRWRNFTHSEDPHSLSDNPVTGIIQDPSGNIWITTYKGLNLVCEEGDSIYFKRFLHDINDPYSLPNNRILSITYVKDNLILGSQGGLYRYDLKEEKFYTIRKDKVSQTIISLMAVDSSNVWAGTRGGILNYHIPSDNIFEYKDIEIGFVNGSINVDQDGALYLGGREGFVRFKPEDIVKNDIAPRVTITEIQTLSPKASQTLVGMNRDSLTLGYDNYQLSISFCSSNFNKPDENRYAYRMLGFDDNWVYTPSNQPIVYTNLEHGSYQFEVKGANNDGVWNEEPTVLHITVKPAFWETPLFRALALLGSIVLISFSTRFYTRSVRNQNQKLLAEITKREQFEKELTLANTELEKSNRELEQFAFIASHDLKEPLQTIDSMSSLLQRKEYLGQMGENGVKCVEFISQSSARMMEIIKSLLSYSTTRQEELSLQYCDFEELVQNTLSDLSEFIKEKKAEIRVDPLPQGYCDPVQIRMVFSNLIMNGIKFNTLPKPHIHIWGDELPNGDLQFAVRDNGIGIEEEFHDKIFGIFKRLHNRDKFEGSGIGLALCYKIIERHEGKIWIESKPGEGSTFRFIISIQAPVEQQLIPAYEVISSKE